MSEPLKKVEVYVCPHCNVQAYEEGGACPLCGKQSVKHVCYDRFRRERVVFMLLAMLLVGAIAAAVAGGMEGGDPGFVFVLGALAVLAVYFGASRFLGLPFTERHAEGEVPDEAKEPFVRAYFVEEVRIFLVTLGIMLVFGIIFVILRGSE